MFDEITHAATQTGADTRRTIQSIPVVQFLPGRIARTVIVQLHQFWEKMLCNLTHEYCARGS
jgi:hypothetical protein